MLRNGALQPALLSRGLAAAGLLQAIARIADRAGQRTRGHCQRARQEHLCLLVPHAAREVAVGGADAAYGRVESAEGVARATQTGGTGCITDLGASAQED